MSAHAVGRQCDVRRVQDPATSGSGGMGEVYLACTPDCLGTTRSRFFPRRFTADAEFRARFTRKAALAAGLFHPHIVGVRDRGEFDG